MAKAKFKVLVESYIGDRICKEGETVDYDEATAGDNLQKIAGDTVVAGKGDVSQGDDQGTGE